MLQWEREYHVYLLKRDTVPWSKVHSPWFGLWRKELEWEKLCTRLYAVIDAIDQRPIAVWWQFLWRSTILSRIIARRITNTTTAIDLLHFGHRLSGSQSSASRRNFSSLHIKQKHKITPWITPGTEPKLTCLTKPKCWHPKSAYRL